MSRRTIKEYMARKREDYEGEFPHRKTRFIDEVCKTTGLSRKYVIRLLNGKVEYRERKGRGKTYGAEVAEVLKAVWKAAGCPCLPYFKVGVARWVEEYCARVGPVGEATKALLLRMSDRTMSRLLSGEVREKPGWSKANKRSGRGVKNEIRELVPCASGETVMACDVPPGDVQIDTFALGGGDGSGDFFWILDTADRHVQWVELAPAWNRAQRSTCAALARCMERFPFAVLALHADNGGEALNHHVMAFLGLKPKRPFVWRSRPRKCNDNAHVEEKNRSVGRQLFGEMRLDCPDLEADLAELCSMWSDFHNFFRPCKMLVSKVKRADGKGFRRVFDKPRTPFERVLESGVLTEEQKRKLMARKAKLNGVALLEKIKAKLAKIKRIQKKYSRDKAKHGHAGAPVEVADLALRAAPPGPSAPLHGRTGASRHDKPSPADYRTARSISVQYLANQKPPPFLAGALSI